MDGRDDGRGAGLTRAAVRLDRRHPYKPLDVGNGIVSGSLTASGRWLEVGIAHARHGRVVATSLPPFPDEDRHDQTAVRAFRAALASPVNEGFGLALLSGPATASLVADSFPRAVHSRRDARIEVLTLAPEGRRGVVQLARIAARADLRLDPAWSGPLRLDRAAYTQLTPGQELAPITRRPMSGGDAHVRWVDDRGLDAAVAVSLPEPVALRGGEHATFVVAVALGRALEETVAEARALASLGERQIDALVERRRGLWTGAALASPRRRLERRAVAYALDCARSEVEGGDAILADHEILPLVWTRDAYYVCRALLGVAPEVGRRVSARFLAWCFETAERPGGWWPRASIASGRAKDLAFQLDQQLFPLLLLEDHARISRDDSLVRRYVGVRDGVLDALLARRSGAGLIATAETPADDPIDAPFHFSSHVLLWRVLRELRPDAAAEVRAATLAHLAVGEMYAYAATAGGAAVRYHDANDLPTVFAPGWGFCAPDDSRWRATVAFAWSAANRAFIDGPMGGLGSVHTPHPWPLGDLQDLVVGRALRDRARVARARARLRAVRTWDGMLPEAYDERSGEVASRHWFAWPVALWALLEHEPRRIAP